MALRLIAGEGQGDGKPRLVAKKGALRADATASEHERMKALLLHTMFGHPAPPSASNRYVGQTTLPGVVQNPKEKK